MTIEQDFENLRKMYDGTWTGAALSRIEVATRLLDEQGELMTRDRDAWRETAYENDRSRQDAEAEVQRLRAALESIRQEFKEARTDDRGMPPATVFVHKLERIDNIARQALKEVGAS